MKRCGTRDRISLSLKLPGSDSSALTTRKCGFGSCSLDGTNDHLRPVAKNAPPRPRSSEAMSSAVTSAGVWARALASAVYPPAASYSARLVVGFARTIFSTSGVTAQLLHDRRDV